MCAVSVLAFLYFLIPTEKLFIDVHDHFMQL